MADLYDAKIYAKYRPAFSNNLFREIVKFYDEGQGNACNRALAVDVGCGNGQSTLPLCNYFQKVIGCDISEAQIDLAKRGPANVRYVVSSGEDMGFLGDDSVDVFSLASALHWMDIDKFYSEVKRALKPGGVLAAAQYEIFPMQPREASDLLKEFYDGLLGPYWDSRRQVWNDKYKTLPCPFGSWTRVESDDIALRQNLDLDSFIGYLTSWSAWQTYQKQHPTSTELQKLREKFYQIYGERSIQLRWPVYLIMCRKPLS